MILGETPRAAGTATTLDDLFRRAGVRHPDALALADPPNRQSFTDGSQRALSFAQADRAISAVAARLRGLGLQTDSAVAIQLPNIVESIIAFLGVLRAGMIRVAIAVALAARRDRGRPSPGWAQSHHRLLSRWARLIKSKLPCRVRSNCFRFVRSAASGRICRTALFRSTTYFSAEALTRP